MKSSLEKAARLYRAGKYTDVIRLLEPQIYKYRESPGFYKLLGLSCIYTGDMSGSSSYLRRGLQLKDDDVELLLGLAAYHVKRQDAGEAISVWFEVLDIDPANKKAKLGLDILKRNAEPGKLADLASSPRFYSILPGNRSGEKIASRLIAVLGVAVVLASASYVLYRFWPREEREAPDMTILQTQILDPNPVDALYTLDEDEVRTSLKNAERYFMDFRDNLAQIELNNVKYSNASQGIKAQAVLLESYLSAPNFASFRDNIQYRDVAKSVYRYNKCHVLWKGRISNLVVDERTMAFDLLVGYEDGRVLEGIVPVTVGFLAAIEPASAVEILARIGIVDGELTLDVVSLRQIVPGSDR